jgi:starvation-inducible DNA-binding protein
MKVEVATNIGLSGADRDGVLEILRALLADEYVLYTKTRNYHWNVVGPQFNDLHKFFESQYEELDDVVDDVAERMRALGGWSPGSLAEFLRSTRLGEHPGEIPEPRRMIADLLEDHEALIRSLRADLETVLERYHDAGTNDFLTGLMERHEKMAWMLRAFLGEESA